MNPIRIALERKSMMKPSLQPFRPTQNQHFQLKIKRKNRKEGKKTYLNNPNEAWKRPAKKVEEKAS
jgi:hypothetical protein